MKRFISSIVALIVLSAAAQARAEPVLLLFHPGGFVAGDASFEDDAATYAQARGFQTVNVDYPLCDVPFAMDYAVHAAATEGADGTPVFAYGDSAGAMLALRLAEGGFVRGGAGYSPLFHFAEFIDAHPSVSIFDCIRDETTAELDSVSPALYPSQAPALSLSGTRDCLAPNRDAVTWADEDPLVWTWQVSGGHLGGTCLGGDGGPGNPTYESNMHGAIEWLSRESQRDSVVSVATQATTSATVGQSITDQAMLAGGVNPTGTITFNAWGPSEDNCAGPPAFTDTVSVSDNGDYQSSDFTPSSTGTYRWTADYSGDSSNDPASSPCNEANETSTVAAASPTLATQALGPAPTGCSVPVSGLVNRGATSKPWVTVTYDEHLSPTNTRSIIQAFDRFDMKGTFFTVGKEAWARPGLTHAILDHGNEIGNHSWSHVDLTQTNDKGLYQYRLTNQTIQAETGFRPCLARPPGGKVDAGVIASAEALGMASVKWGHSPCWCDPNPHHIAQTALDGVQPGQIILLHQTDADTQALPMILQGLQDRGLRSVPTTALLGGHLAGATLGRPIHNSTSLVSGYRPTGTLTFRAYGPDDDKCSNTPAFKSNPVTVAGNDNYESPAFTPAQAGVYRWTVGYSGDSNNDAAGSRCRSANGTSTIAQARPSLTTTASPGIAVGGKVHDIANLRRGYGPGGKITFRFYRPGDTNCIRSPVFKARRSVTGNGSYRSAAFKPTQTGNYRWRTSYSGDPGNKAVADPCNAANESVTISQWNDGKATRVRTYLDPDAALKAAGLRD